MKSSIKIFGKTLLYIIIFEILVFILMIVFLMTDESKHGIGDFFQFIIKYVFGSPLVAINDSYPFFLNDKVIPNYMLLLVLTNNIIQAFLILFFKKYFINAIKNIKDIIYPKWRDE